MRETGITARRRQTFGDLTSALGFSNGKPATYPRHLLPTITEFWKAETEVETLPPWRIPGANQPPPADNSAAADVEAAAAPTVLQARDERGDGPTGVAFA